MQSALKGGGSGFVLAGAAEIGKTRLAVEFLALAERSGARVVRVTATRSASPLPLGAFAPLLPSLHHGETGGVDDRADLLRRCANFLVESAGGRRLVLFADDAHLLDDASATLVHQMAVTGMAFVVTTIRADDPAPDPVVALWKDDNVERLELSGLRADSLEELLLNVLGGPVDRAAIHRLAVGSQGNVLFLHELVLGALDDGTLRDDVGIWRLVGPLAPSSRLAGLVETRLYGLSQEERALLEVLSAGEPMGQAELTQLGDPGLAEALERKGILESRAEGRRLELRLGHSLYGDVIRARTPALRNREVTRLRAEAVEATGARRREDLLRVATWRLEGGSAQPGVMLAAATQARWRYDFPLAERLVEAAIQVGAGFDAHLLRAQLAALQGRGAAAETALSALATAAQDDRQRGLVAVARLDNHVFGMGHIEAGLQMAEEAESQISDQAWRDELAAKRASVIHGQQGPRAGEELGAPLLERAKGRSFLYTSIITAYSRGRIGMLRAAEETAARALEAHEALNEPFEWYPWTHTFFRGEALAHGGRLDEAYALAEEHYHEGVADHSPEEQAWFAWQLSKTVADRGYPKTAAVHGRAAVALFNQLGRPLFEHFALGYLALALAIDGNAAEAGDCLARLDALKLPEQRYWAVDVLQARAWTAAAGGDVPGARRHLEEAVSVGDEIGDLVGQAAALHTLARLGHAQEVCEPLAKLVSHIEGDLAPARAEHAAALATGDRHQLEALSERFEAMGATLLAAESAADAAVAWRRWGDPRRAAKAEQRANTLAAQCENPATPPLLAVKSRSRLTRAEREAALLAAGGRTNKEIATQLGISVRTVENHLQHVYEKLGISGRSKLSEGLENAY